MINITVKKDNEIYSSMDAPTRDILMKYALIYIMQALEDCDHSVSIEVKES